MIWEALGSAALGLALAHIATRRLPGKLPHRPLVLATGPVAGLLGGLVSRIVLGPGHVLPTLACALGVAAAILSLLVKDDAPGATGRRAQGADGGSSRPSGSLRRTPVRQPAPARPSASYGPR